MRALRSLPLLLLGLLAGLGPAGAASDWQRKVEPALLAAVAHGRAEALIVLGEQADLAPAAALPTRAEKGRFVVARLQQTARELQAGLLAELAARGIDHQPFWVANFVAARLDAPALAAVAARDEVAAVELSGRFSLPPAPAETPPRPESPDGVEWGLAKVQAPPVWALGIRGQGVVVGGQDTGYEWNHPALREQYRGWNGSSASHAFHWHDAIHAGGGSCGANSPEPCDDHGHGTHTAGTMVGDDGGTNQIGMAPAARWIGCRNMNQGYGTPATYSECFQWFLAPTDLAGQHGDPALAPAVINNSWGCPPAEGCTYPEILRTVVENVRAAGIVVVASAGNSGSSCATVQDPPAIYAAAFTVGATDANDTIAGFSSRGPVTVDGSGRLKPDIAAPGSSVRSAIRGGGYGTMSGTSMAGPHVAGLVALILSAAPALDGRVETIERLIARSAVPLGTSQLCHPDIPAGAVPNPTFGHGRIDALAAVAAALDWIFEDGFESGGLPGGWAGWDSPGGAGQP
ncbi:MAG: S8 family serine peptidase [Acidobacteria bacterium]|nr:S8 family serine peptidase [Thermoanaerobaculia bacterium]MBP7813640.1 S8 family serine peptidase [Thermoanaerobaculia bacterium]NLN12147.1 S8 family serine peptidase [Acidobacteriota bacterium]HQN39108.1 S8 family serine peptidase [Thermoanaerobaculia bacterium]